MSSRNFTTLIVPRASAGPSPEESGEREGGISYHLIHDGGVWFWFVFPAAAAMRIGWVMVKRPPRWARMFGAEGLVMWESASRR